MNNIGNEEIYLAIVVSRFNEEITDNLLTGAIKRCEEMGIPTKNISVAHVPGAVEIPLVASRFASTQRYDAIITLGCVIRGETSHYDTVCQHVTYGVQKVSLEFDIPVIFGVLTTENSEQARDRIGGAHGHKGVESVDAALEMIDLLNSEDFV